MALKEVVEEMLLFYRSLTSSYTPLPQPASIYFHPISVPYYTAGSTDSSLITFQSREEQWIARQANTSQLVPTTRNHGILQQPNISPWATLPQIQGSKCHARTS